MVPGVGLAVGQVTRAATNQYFEANLLTFKVTLTSLSGAVQVAAHPANFLVRIGSDLFGMEPLGALEPGGCAGQLAPINGAVSCWLFAFIPAAGPVTELRYDDGAYVGTTPLSISAGPAIHLEAAVVSVSAATGVSVAVTLSSQNGATTQVDRDIDFAAFRADGSSITGYWVGDSLFTVPPNGSVSFYVGFDGPESGYTLRQNLRRIVFANADYASEVSVSPP